MMLRYLQRSHLLLSLYWIFSGMCVYQTYRQYQDKQANIWVCLARSSAALVILNSQIIMLSMMRVTISRFKYYRFSQWFLLDKHINIHQMAGHAFFISGIVHILAYLGLAITKSYSLTSNLSGCVLCGLVAFFWLCANPYIRKSRYFELFYYSHYLFFPIQIILCIHSAKYRQDLFLPTLGYFLDRGYRFYCIFYPSQIIDFKIWSSQVLELRVSRPQNFNYHSGDYTFVCIPAVSKTQWHPFSFSSDPNNPHYITIHMRIAGNWTEQVQKLCQDFLKSRETQKYSFQPLVYLDGPLSTPSSLVNTTQHVILVAQGIGATPYVSFLKYYLSQGLAMSGVRVDFFWLARDQGTFEWATPTFNAIASKQMENVNIHLRTSKEINWLEELSSIEKKTKPTIFICGSERLGQELAPVASKLRFRLKQENF